MKHWGKETQRALLVLRLRSVDGETSDGSPGKGGQAALSVCCVCYRHENTIHSRQAVLQVVDRGRKQNN